MPVAIEVEVEIVALEVHDPPDGTAQRAELRDTEMPDGAEVDRGIPPRKPLTLVTWIPDNPLEA